MHKIVHYNHSEYGIVGEFFSSLSVFELIIYIGIITFVGYVVNRTKKY